MVLKDREQRNRYDFRCFFLVDWVVSYLYMFKLACQISISYLCMFHKKEKKIHSNGSPPVDQEV